MISSCFSSFNLIKFTQVILYSFTDQPTSFSIPDTMKTASNSVRRQWLFKHIESFLEAFVFDQDDAFFGDLQTTIIQNPSESTKIYE